MESSLNISSERTFFYNPDRFKPEDFVPKKWCEAARYFVHVLYTHRVFDHRRRHNFIPLKAEYLRRVMPFRDYRKIIDRLVAGGVVEADRHYVIGSKCHGFRLAPDWIDARHARHEVTSKRIRKKLARLKDEAMPRLDVHRHLYRYLIQLTVAGPPPDDEPQEVRLQDSMIRHKDFKFSSCPFGRVHTNITNLKKSLRNSLRWHGQHLVNIDIANSQPLFFALLAMNYLSHEKSLYPFNSLESSKSYLELSKPYYHQQQHNKQQHNNTSQERGEREGSKGRPLRCDIFHSSHETLPGDVLAFKGLCERGEVYDCLMVEAGYDDVDRETFKRRFFGRVLYCKNAVMEETWEGRLFRRLFPTLFDIAHELKARDYERLAQLMQKVESSFIINRVVRRMMNEFPDTFVSTIHDSVFGLLPKNRSMCYESL